jgi:hypothetical protein
MALIYWQQLLLLLPQPVARRSSSLQLAAGAG